MILDIISATDLPRPMTVTQLRDLLGLGTGGSLMPVFSGVKGATPSTTPSVVSQTSINQSTNELWFVNSSLAWQQVIAA